MRTFFIFRNFDLKLTLVLNFFLKLCLSVDSFPSGSVVKNPPAMQELQVTLVRSLGQEDPLEKAWQPNLVFLPGESHGQGSVVAYRP